MLPGSDAARALRAFNRPELRTCEVCGLQWMAQKTARYCSNRCTLRARYAKIRAARRAARAAAAEAAAEAARLAGGPVAPAPKVRRQRPRPPRDPRFNRRPAERP